MSWGPDFDSMNSRSSVENRIFSSFWSLSKRWGIHLQLTFRSESSLRKIYLTISWWMFKMKAISFHERYESSTSSARIASTCSFEQGWSVLRSFRGCDRPQRNGASSFRWFWAKWPLIHKRSRFDQRFGHLEGPLTRGNGWRRGF
jgi:hypothetical protein